MRTILQVIAVAVVGLGLSFTIVGCGRSTPAGTDNMQGGKMSTDKMSTDKMSGDKMSGDKMSGGKMGTDKMQGDNKEK